MRYFTKSLLGLVLWLAMVAPALALTGDSTITVADGQIVLVTPVIVGSGGTGTGTLTDGSVILGAGTAVVEFADPGANPQALISAGAGVNPAFGALDLDGTSTVSNELDLTFGGTNASSFTADRCVRVNAGGTALEAAAADCAVAGQNLLQFTTNMIQTTGVTLYIGAGVDVDAEDAALVVNNAVTLDQLACVNSTIQGVANDVVVTLMEDSTGLCDTMAADTETVCTITGTANPGESCTDEDSEAIAAGGCYVLRVVTPGSLTASARVSCTMERTG